MITAQYNHIIQANIKHKNIGIICPTFTVIARTINRYSNDHVLIMLNWLCAAAFFSALVTLVADVWGNFLFLRVDISLMKSVGLIFRYTQNEYIKAEKQFLIANKIIRKYDPIIATAFLLFSMAYLFLSQFGTFSIVFSAITLIVLILGSFIYFCLPFLKFKHTSKYHQEYALVFTNDAIRWKTPSVESELKWNIYSEIWVSNDFYYLFQAPRVYTLIPKRAFAKEEDMQTFEEIASSNIKSIKHIV